MTYSNFLIFFICPPIFLLLIVTWLDHRKKKEIPSELSNLPPWVTTIIHVILALIYTTPWDNYLVATGVWYYFPNLVFGINLGWVPIEEYTFFIFQTIFASLWLFFLLRRIKLPDKFSPSPRIRAVSTVFLSVVWFTSTLYFFSDNANATYLSIILAWALIPILLQTGFAADILWHYRKLVLLSIIPITGYLCIVDSLAINSGTWTISPAQSTGIMVFSRLPIEEMVFFLLTNVLITFGTILFQSKISRDRALIIVSLTKNKNFKLITLLRK